MAELESWAKYRESMQLIAEKFGTTVECTSAPGERLTVNFETARMREDEIDALKLVQDFVMIITEFQLNTIPMH